jgi:nucleoside-diphosphate-sugar epimerase
MGYESVKSRKYLPSWLMFGIAYAGVAVSTLTGMNFRINPFTVKMLTIHRWFNIKNAKNDLNYKPVVTSEEGFRLTMEWFKKNEEWSNEMAKRSLG